VQACSRADPRSSEVDGAEAAFSVWARIQAGEPLTVAVCREVITELDSTARANEVFYLVRPWQADITRTRRLGGR
jgi:hypothetical protein